MAPLEQFLEESGEPHLIINSIGYIVYETPAAKSLLGIATTLDAFDADNSLAELLAGWRAQRQCFGYTGAAKLRSTSGTGAMCLTGRAIEYHGSPHLLCRLCPREAEVPAGSHLWSAVSDAARESAFAAAGALVEHKLNQSLAAIVNYVQTSAILLNGQTEETRLVRDALSEAGQQALQCADELRALRRGFGYRTHALAGHSLSGVLRQVHALLNQTRDGNTVLDLQGAEPDLFVQLSHAHFVSMSVLLMRRCLRSSGASNKTVKVSIAAEGDEHAVVRFLECGAWQLDAAVAGSDPGVSCATGNDDMRLLAICRATMSLHGGRVSIAEDARTGHNVKLTLKIVKIGGNQNA